MTTTSFSTATSTNYFTQFGRNPEAIQNRIQELEKEWDLERVYELNSTFSELDGTLLGKILNKNHTKLPFSTITVLTQEKGESWNAPISHFKSLGYRSAEEIEAEKQALKALKEEIEAEFNYASVAVA